MSTRPAALIGVNLPWFFGAYGHDLAVNDKHRDWGSDFDAMKSYRPLIEARDMGFAAVRIWLCENGEGITVRDGVVEGVEPALLESVRVVQECAKLVGLRVYWSLLDGNSWEREGDTLTHSIVNDPAQSERFARLVAAPLTAVFDPAVTFAVEVINEPEAMSPDSYKDAKNAVPWSGMGRFLRTTGDAIRTARPGTTVTAGALHVFLPKLWKSDPRLDAIDIHAYHATGGLPSRDDLATYADDPRLADLAIPLIAGECGIPDEAPIQDQIEIQNYLYNAESRGYAAAFLWRLESTLIDNKDPARKLTAAGDVVRKQLLALRDRDAVAR